MNSQFKRLEVKALDLWFQYEPWLFVLLTTTSLLPVWGVDYFFTGDGPAHLYNSNLILQLIREPGGRASEFFELRPELIPNMGGHMLLATLNAFLPANLAEKLVYSLCLISVPLGFRYVLSAVDKSLVPYSILAFPLAHHFCFYIGFQGFCLGVGLALISLGYFISLWSAPSLIRWIILAVLIWVTAFFHLFAAVLLIMAMSIKAVWSLFFEGLKQWKPYLLLTASILPGLVFCASFVLQNTSGGFEFNQTDFGQQLKGLLVGLPLITIDTDEIRFSRVYSIILGLSLVLGLLYRLRSQKDSRSDHLLIIGLLLVLLYFLMPDKLASGSFMSLRLIWCAYLFLALWAAAQLKKLWPTLIIACAVLVLNIRLVYYHWYKADELSGDVVALQEVVPLIPKGSTVLPLNYSYHWLQYNIGLYLGSEKDLIVLDNYEASATHFPVRWLEKSFPGERLGDFGTSHRPLLKVVEYEEFSGHKLDAVVRWKHSSEINDSISLITDRVLEKYFRPVYISEDQGVELHLRK